MNLVLFSEEELDSPLPRSDGRAAHILEILKRTSGETFDAGVIDGRMGKARVVDISENAITLSFDLPGEPPPLYPVELVVGLSRPQTMRRVLRECTSLGVSRLSFFASERGERGYARSKLWRTGEARSCLIDGAQQAFSTRLPTVDMQLSLAECMADLRSCHLRIALDNYEASESLGAFLRSRGVNAHQLTRSRVALFVGSERGWSPNERSMLRSEGVPLVHLGARVLRTDAACIAAVSIALSHLGVYDRLFADTEVGEHRVEDVG